MRQQFRTPPANVPADLYQEIEGVVLDPDLWLKTPNDQLGGKAPEDLIGTDQEPVLRNLVQMIKHGMVS